ncbi:MAG TPA: PAS domain-containing sensor histidine kinase [Candidatus Thermoplasmatota archaeon]|nr:PAS domain-containing sensor histidine kinase [Candidatus Thermoplasmatota archaeon]
MDPRLEAHVRSHLGDPERLPVFLSRFLEAVDIDYRAADAGAGYDRAVWRAVLDSALDAVIVMDGRGLVREFNAAAEATFGHKREDAVGRELAELIIPQRYRTAHRLGLARYLATGDGPVLHKRLQIEGLRADGQEFPIELAIVPFEVGGDRLFAGYVRDRTAAVDAERELARRQRTVQLLLQVPVAAVEARSVDEVIRLCLEGVCQFAAWPVGHALRTNEAGDAVVSTGIWHNREGLDLAAFRDASAAPFPRGVGLPGRVLETAKPVWVRDVQEDARLPRSRLALGIGLRGAFAFPVRIGERVLGVLEFFSHAPAELDPELMSVVSTVGDQVGRVLERQQREQELLRAHERLRELDETRARFVSAAAHELNTPLTPIAIQLQMLAASLEASATPMQKRSLDTLQRNVGRLQVLVGDLLDAARLQSDRMRIDARPGDLRDLLRQAVAAQAPVAEDQGIALRFEDGPPAPAHFDPRRILQVVDNLLNNAFKFTAPGGTVTVRARPEADHVVAEVQDSGAGFDPSLAHRLFQPFQQLDEGRRRTGTGLGLYVSRGIIESHGGRVEAHSDGPGRGATFRFTLPRAGLASDAQVGESRPPAGRVQHLRATAQPHRHDAGLQDRDGAAPAPDGVARPLDGAARAVDGPAGGAA